MKYQAMMKFARLKSAIKMSQIGIFGLLVCYNKLRLLDTYASKIAKICVLACDSADKPSFQNPSKSPFAQCSIDVKSAVKRLLIGF